MSKLIVRNLYKIFGSNPQKGLKLLKEGKDKKEILKTANLTVGINNVSFEVEEGETFVVMGLSGSGKSTVIRCLNRLIEPSAGEVILDGNDIMEMNKRQLIAMRRKAMSMVFQNFALLPNRSVLANAEYGLEVQGISKTHRAEKAKESLALVGLGEYENSMPDELSGGMKQRVGLARALANDPEILLMDEAFSALDPLIRSDMQDELIDLQQKMKKTIIFITHDLDEALKIGDRIMLMKDGEAIQIGTPEEILTNPADDYVKRFVQGVNKSDILTAADIMIKPWTTANISQGPRRAIAECRHHGLDTLLVTKEDHILVGTVTLKDLQKAIDQGKNTLHGFVNTDDFISVSRDCSLVDVIQPTLESPIPVPVTGESGKLLGVIIKSSVLRALIAERGEVNA